MMLVHVTCSICCPSIAIFILGEFGFLLTTIALVFLILIFIPNCFRIRLFCLLSLIVPFHSLLIMQRHRHISKIVVICASRVDTLICLEIFSVYKLKRVRDATHPCLTPRCIRISSDNSFMFLTDPVWPQYKFLMIFMSFPYTPISLGHWMSGSCLTRSNALS